MRLFPSLALAATLTTSARAAAPTDQPTPSNPHPPALNTATCDYHGTTSPYDADYADFEDALEGPSANLTSIRARLEKHQVGGASVAIIEAGRVTQVHWYGCRDRKRALRTTSSTLYQAASLSKFVASVGMVHADRVGDLSLDDDLAELAEDFPDSFLADMVDHHFRRDAADYPEDITVRRLLNHTAGLDTHSIGAWSPGNVPTMEDILLGSNDFDGYFDGGVEPLAVDGQPGYHWSYSGGGYVVAEHILQLQSPLAFKDYLRNHVLTPAGMTLSTFDKASTSMSQLVRGCSRSTCSYDLQQTNVKAAGGLLANAREYAELVTALYWGGTTGRGNAAMTAADVRAILTPASARNASYDACTTVGANRTVYLTIAGIRAPYAIETCIGGKWRVPIDADDDDGVSWYGLGVNLSTELLADGYPRKVSHGGAQEGSRTFFELDRRDGDGIVIMINGVAEWTDGNGIVWGAEPFLDEIHQAWHDVY